MANQTVGWRGLPFDKLRANGVGNGSGASSTWGGEITMFWSEIGVLTSIQVFIPFF